MIDRIKRLFGEGKIRLEGLTTDNRSFVVKLAYTGDLNTMNKEEIMDCGAVIHSIDGVRVWEEHESAGAINDKFEWDGHNAKGEEVANGLYIVFVKGPGLEAATKIVKGAE